MLYFVMRSYDFSGFVIFVLEIKNELKLGVIT